MVMCKVLTKLGSKPPKIDDTNTRTVSKSRYTPGIDRD
jgi:hypothetical protein